MVPEEPAEGQKTAPAADPVVEPEAEQASSPPPRARRRLAPFLLLAFGAATALYLGAQGPREQHVRIVLGAAAPQVTGLTLQYTGAGGEVAREANFTFRAGSAPRIVAHEPQLPNGDYRLEIDVDAQGGRRVVQRQVTLGGGSTQVDVSTAVSRETQ